MYIPIIPKTNSLIRSLDFLHPSFQHDLSGALFECWNQKLMVYVFESFRTVERQNDLYSQGRTKKGRIVTNAKGLQSYHNFGLAFDLVFDGSSRDGIQWSWEGDYNTERLGSEMRSDYTRVGEIFESYGFEWAARWKSFKETPHFQKTHGLRIDELKLLYQEGGLGKVWKHV